MRLLRNRKLMLYNSIFILKLTLSRFTSAERQQLWKFPVRSNYSRHRFLFQKSNFCSLVEVTIQSRLTNCHVRQRTDVPPLWWSYIELSFLHLSNSSLSWLTAAFDLLKGLEGHLEQIGKTTRP